MTEEGGKRLRKATKNDQTGFRKIQLCVKENRKIERKMHDRVATRADEREGAIPSFVYIARAAAVLFVVMGVFTSLRSSSAGRRNRASVLFLF